MLWTWLGLFVKSSVLPPFAEELKDTENGNENENENEFARET